MLKAKVHFHHRPTLLLGLSTLNQQRLLDDMPIPINGQDVDLPQMRAMLVAAQTHQALIERLRTELNMPADVPMHGSEHIEAQDRVMRIPCRRRSGAPDFLMIGFSAANLALLSAGAIFHIDGRNCQAPGVKLCLVGLDVEANDMTPDQVHDLASRCAVEGIRL